MRELSYQYKNLSIPGGGYVTGFIFHKKKKGLLYLRTDIGGTYRFDPEHQRWCSLISHVTPEDLSETFPISVALDDDRPERLYIACGENREKSGVLAISEDYGETFRYEKIPVMIHGNLNGRGTGERLAVDCMDSDRLWFASQQEGLWTSKDRGAHWEKCSGLPEEYLTFAGWVGQTLLVGTAGVTTASESGKRGHSLYISVDRGRTFVPLEEPVSREIEGCRMNGLVAQRFSVDEKYLYVTFASTGRRSYVLENGYSCDSGDTIDGRIVRYAIGADGAIGAMEEITPGSASAVTGIGQEQIRQGDSLEYGFSGISASRRTPGLVIASTIVKDDGDSIFLSEDYGTTWKQILFDLVEGKISFRAPYMRPECNGGHSLIHWLSDLQIDPFCDDTAWFNTGTGVFRTENLKEKDCCFTDWCDGLEETVHLNVYSMPKGDVQVIDILGDLGGFVFEDLDQPCGNSFADSEGNRYITCINADFSDEHPEDLVVTPRGNWKGKTKGGLILSEDQGRTFTRLELPYGLSEDLDEAFRNIEQPNVNSGWAALSPDGKTIVWSVADVIELPVSRMLVSQDRGKTFRIAEVYQADGMKKITGNVKVFSDRVDSSLFYGFGDHSDFYVSRDGGLTFHEKKLPAEFPCVDFGKIDCANKTEVRGETGKSGVFYLALAEQGLWKLRYDRETEENGAEEKITVKRLSGEGDTVFCVGLGVGRPGGDYYTEEKALYVSGRIGGHYGFYRTLDEGRTFERLNTDRQQFGEIHSIDGDCRVFGRFFLATGSNGVLYGEPKEQENRKG